MDTDKTYTVLELEDLEQVSGGQTQELSWDTFLKVFFSE